MAHLRLLHAEMLPQIRAENEAWRAKYLPKIRERNDRLRIERERRIALLDRALATLLPDEANDVRKLFL